MKNVSIFQIAVLAIFILVAIVGIAIFAGFGGFNKKSIPTATIWGTVPSGLITEMVRKINENENLINVTYVQKNPETFENEFVNALAEGGGPDVVLLADDLLYAQRNKLQPIPFATYNERDYLNTFIDGAQHFIGRDGILGVPLSVDPMVMYFNKNILASASISRAPLTWSEVEQMAPSVIQKTDTSTIVRALVPFGEYANVTNAKEILATLMFQHGNPITALNKTTDTVVSTLEQQGVEISSPADKAVSLYTSFANPSKQIYTWNRSMPASLDTFLSGDLALYFGHASELFTIQNKNPNLNFDVTVIPTLEGGIPATYGKITAFSITKRTKNFAGALGVIAYMTSNPSIAHWSSISSLPPVRRDLLASPATDAYMTVFQRAAIQSRTWFDPNTQQSDAIFRDMIEFITSGRKKSSDAISEARQRLDRLLK